MNSSIHLPEVEFRNVDIVFGDRVDDAIQLLDQGESREDVLTKTGSVIGVSDASVAVQKGEICVLMGLSGSGKSTLLRAVNGLNKVTRGEVLINHAGRQIDIAKIDATELREIRMSRISMVFSSSH